MICWRMLVFEVFISCCFGWWGWKVLVIWVWLVGSFLVWNFVLIWSLNGVICWNDCSCFNLSWVLCFVIWLIRIWILVVWWMIWFWLRLIWLISCLCYCRYNCVFLVVCGINWNNWGCWCLKCFWKCWSFWMMRIIWCGRLWIVWCGCVLLNGF